MPAGGLPGGEHGRGEGQHRVLPVGQPGRARRGWPRPVKSKRQRPCGQIALGDADRRAQRSASARPCSMCSSTKAPMPASSSSSGPMPAGSCPAAVIASARLTPSPSRSARAAPGSITPVSSRLPRQATPNRAPSSSPKAATAIGRAGTQPALAQQVDRGERGDHAERPVERAAVRHRVQVAAGHDRARRPRRAGRPGGSHQAHRLPLRSARARAARARAAASRNQARQARSASRPGEPPVAAGGSSRPTGSSDSQQRGRSS